MSKIVHLSIKNFRGIKGVSLNFSPDNTLVCFIGRGDSCKTTVLEAISAVLSSSWNLSFYDTDFHECNVTELIEIEASLIDIPEKLLSENKYGLFIKGYNRKDKTITDDVLLESINEDYSPLLTIKLKVDSSLEPKWFVSNQRNQEDKTISAADRGLLNCYLVSDYVDRHFSWNKGNPLYSLLKSSEHEDSNLENDIVMDALRLAKQKIDENDFDKLSGVTDDIVTQAATFGLNLKDVKTTLDMKELSLKDGRISLHENSIPFRLKGKGTKRLASFSIQSALVKNGGIMLVDEIEQGLEPDRVKQVVRTLKNDIQAGQVFLTTHSREAVTELAVDDLYLFIKEKNSPRPVIKRLETNNLQAAVRSCPEAFFAKKVIVCEGATEVGICRALDKWRISQNKEQMSMMDCAYVDGTGSTLSEKVEEINECGLKTALFCDSDNVDINCKKEEWKKSGIAVFDCENDFCIEQQIFKDLPWGAIKELITYITAQHYKGVIKSLEQAIESKLNGGKLSKDWLNTDNDEIRETLANASRKNKKDKDEKSPVWFKTIYHGEVLGDIIFKYLKEMTDEKHLKATLKNLSDWIDQ